MQNFGSPAFGISTRSMEKTKDIRRKSIKKEKRERKRASQTKNRNDIGLRGTVSAEMHPVEGGQLKAKENKDANIRIRLSGASYFCGDRTPR